MQTEVDSYVDSIPPSCQLELHFQRTQQPYERLSHQIKVNGIRGISTFTITRDVDPGKYTVILCLGHAHPVIKATYSITGHVPWELVLVQSQDWVSK